MSIEWDSRKAASNLQKHGIDFADAVTALDDDHAITVQDTLSAGETRYITVGYGCNGPGSDGGLHLAW
jgi:hypothetical protein